MDINEVVSIEGKDQSTGKSLIDHEELESHTMREASACYVISVVTFMDGNLDQLDKLDELL